MALVTGCSRGIGRAVALGLSRLGAIVIVSARDHRSADAVAAEIRSASGHAESLCLDVADPKSIVKAGESVKARHRELHVLVNNAGILKDAGFATADVPLPIFDETLRVNLRGTLLVIQELLPLLRAARWGRIVNLTSGLGRLSDGMSGGYPAYRMSKTAVNALTANLASELSGTGILVNAVDPGWVRTDMGGPSAPRSIEEGADTVLWAATLPDDGPTGRVLHSRDVADF